MPYKPKWNVVHAESSDCRADVESELPDDLQAVANQLTDDARHLGSQFPARLPTFAPAEFTQSSQTAIWRRAAAAVLLIGIGAAGAVLSQHFLRWREPAAPNRRAEIAQTLDQSRPNPGGVQEVNFDRAAPRAKLTEVEMLRIQLDAFEKVIRRLQDELTERQKSAAQTKQLVELLRHEIDDLRSQLDGAEPPTE